MIRRIGLLCALAVVVLAQTGCTEVPEAPPEDVSKYIKPEDRLIHAIETKDIDGVRAALATGVDPNLPGSGELPPLHVAAVEGFVDAGKLLIENRADINLISLRLEKGADGQPSQRPGNGPLHTAVMAGKVDFAKMLIDRHADINLRNGSDMTPLDMATGRTMLLKRAEEQATDPDQIKAISDSMTNTDAIVALLKEHGAQSTEDIEAARLREIKGGLIGDTSLSIKKHPPRRTLNAPDDPIDEDTKAKAPKVERLLPDLDPKSPPPAP